MQNNEQKKISEDDLEKVDGGVVESYDADSETGKMLLDGICPHCFFKDKRKVKVINFRNYIFCEHCLGQYWINEK